MADYDEITKLAELKDRGHITDAEYNEQKDKVLSENTIYVRNSTPNKFTFKAIAYFALGLIFPFWPLSLPIFWYLAYKAYKRGD
jgi:cell division septal protein FtsQ